MASHSDDEKWTYFAGLERLHLNYYGRPACRGWHYDASADVATTDSDRCARCLEMESALYPEPLVQRIVRRARSVVRRRRPPAD